MPIHYNNQTKHKSVVYGGNKVYEVNYKPNSSTTYTIWNAPLTFKAQRGYNCYTRIYRDALPSSIVKDPVYNPTPGYSMPTLSNTFGYYAYNYPDPYWLLDGYMVQNNGTDYIDSLYRVGGRYKVVYNIQSSDFCHFSYRNNRKKQIEYTELASVSCVFNNPGINNSYQITVSDNLNYNYLTASKDTVQYTFNGYYNQLTNRIEARVNFNELTYQYNTQSGGAHLPAVYKAYPLTYKRLHVKVYPYFLNGGTIPQAFYNTWTEDNIFYQIKNSDPNYFGVHHGIYRRQGATYFDGQLTDLQELDRIRVPSRDVSYNFSYTESTGTGYSYTPNATSLPTPTISSAAANHTSVIVGYGSSGFTPSTSYPVSLQLYRPSGTSTSTTYTSRTSKTISLPTGYSEGIQLRFFRNRTVTKRNYNNNRNVYLSYKNFSQHDMNLYEIGYNYKGRREYTEYQLNALNKSYNYWNQPFAQMWARDAGISSVTTNSSTYNDTLYSSFASKTFYPLTISSTDFYYNTTSNRHYYYFQNRNNYSYSGPTSSGFNYSLRCQCNGYTKDVIINAKGGSTVSTGWTNATFNCIYNTVSAIVTLMYRRGTSVLSQASIRTEIKADSSY